jgi:hypothetical protein
MLPRTSSIMQDSLLFKLATTGALAFAAKIPRQAR